MRFYLRHNITILGASWQMFFWNRIKGNKAWNIESLLFYAKFIQYPKTNMTRLLENVSLVVNSQQKLHVELNSTKKKLEFNLIWPNILLNLQAIFSLDMAK